MSEFDFFGKLLRKLTVIKGKIRFLTSVEFCYFLSHARQILRI